MKISISSRYHRFVILTSIAKKGIREGIARFRPVTNVCQQERVENSVTVEASVVDDSPTLSLLSKAFELTVFEHPRRRPGYVHKHNYFLSTLLFAELFPRPLPPFPFVLPSIISVSR